MVEQYFNPSWDETMDSYFDGARHYSWHRYSSVSGKTLLDIDFEASSLRYGDPFTRAEAVCAALRCYESWEARGYAHTTDEEAVNYDPSIITEDLLTRESSLPEVTHTALPSEWRGVWTMPKGKFDFGNFCPYSEREVRFVAENGMNFLRVLMGFKTLRYPDFPDDGSLINVAELRDLDKLIAWAIKYDVHLSLSMVSIPSMGAEAEDGVHTIEDNDWPDATQWEMIHQYWVMLAARYRDIPARYLTFELCTECGADEPEHLAEFNEKWTEIVSDMRQVSPNRVLIAGFDRYDNSKAQMADFMASIGVSLAVHPYVPGHVAFCGGGFVATGIDKDMHWPLAYFPTGDFDAGLAPITITGNIGGTELSLYSSGGESVWMPGVGPKVRSISADGKDLPIKEPTDGSVDHMTCAGAYRYVPDAGSGWLWGSAPLWRGTLAGRWLRGSVASRVIGFAVHWLDCVHGLVGGWFVQPNL